MEFKENNRLEVRAKCSICHRDIFLYYEFILYNGNFNYCKKCSKNLLTSIVDEKEFNKLLKIEDPTPKYNVRGTMILNYSTRIHHNGLNEFKILSAPTLYDLECKKNEYINKLIEKWKKHINNEEALQKTKNAEKEIKNLESILKSSLSKDYKIEWDSLKLNEYFNEPEPVKPIGLGNKKYPQKPNKKEYPPKPDKSSKEYSPKFNIFDNLIKSKKEKKIIKYREKFNKAIKEWELKKKQIDKVNENSNNEWELLKKKIDEAYENNCNEYTKKLKKWEEEYKDWEKRKNEFYKKQKEYNEEVEKSKTLYEKKEKNAVIKYCNMVLENSEYPYYFPKSYDIDYIPDTKILIVEYFLPSPEIMPKVKEVKYVASINEFKETYISKSQLEEIYDYTLYQITLRTLYELFISDKIDAIEAISFNGWVNYTNKATGKSETSCILSLQVKKSEFTSIDFKNVDPKTCFRNLKGISASKLIGLAPVKPILQMDRRDSRFIEAREIANKLDEKTNIAAMDWQDFEHLIRELFEKVFSITGGEVKITQSSRDRGVDAVVYDPDPIKGGKIVIQAKRYTNVVGVDAVRDLYGTVINEGANKGILVTTSNYGPEAYEFAKDKNLTLINGNHLLYLLEEHGHKVKIDLIEAKKILGEKI